MTNQHDSFPDMMHEDLGFEVVMRGYSRRQVHDHMVRTRNQIRDLEERLARAIDQAEQGRIELAEARRRLAEAPQDYDELGQRLSQILKLGEEEAIAKRQSADTDATKVREDAAAEAERILTAAQAEAERRVQDATIATERLLAQAGSDAEETLGAARAEAEETLRNARAEADRVLTAAQHEAERLVSQASAEADATLGAARAEAEATLISARTEAGDLLTSAGQRAASLDEHTGHRVTFLTDTHTEVMRRLTEMGSVLTDLLHREGAAGPLVDESAVVPPRPAIDPVEDTDDAGAPGEDERELVRVVLEDSHGDGAGAGGEGEPLVQEGVPTGQADAAYGPGGVAVVNDPRRHEQDEHDPRRPLDAYEPYDAHGRSDVREQHDVLGANDVHGVLGANDVHGVLGGNDVLGVHGGNGVLGGDDPHGRNGMAGDLSGQDGGHGRGEMRPEHEMRVVDHQVNDHEPPAGRIRGFFEDTDVHVHGTPDQAGDPGLGAQRR